MCNLWPATPSKPKLAFTVELMDLIHGLVLECQVTIHDVVNFLKLSGKNQPEVMCIIIIIHMYILNILFV